MPIGSSERWLTLAGMMARPRATSLRTSSGSIFSRRATYSISSVITPCRAKCICEKLREPFAATLCANRFSIQGSRRAITLTRTDFTPKKPRYGNALSRLDNYIIVLQAARPELRTHYHIFLSAVRRPACVGASRRKALCAGQICYRIVTSRRPRLERQDDSNGRTKILRRLRDPAGCGQQLQRPF